MCYELFFDNATLYSWQEMNGEEWTNARSQWVAGYNISSIVVVVIEFINNNTYLFSRWNEDMTPSTSSTSTSSSSVVNDSMLEMTIYDVRRYYRFTFAMTNT